MSRRGGRAGDYPPGPGTGAHAAVGTAAIPTTAAPTEPANEPTAAPLYAPAPTAEVVLALANEVCNALAQAEAARAMAGYAASEAEHAHLTARAAQWDALVNERWAALVVAIQTALPRAAQVERFMPVRPLSNGHVELHANDTAARRLVVLLSGAQALAVGAHLSAYGAISLDRTGQRLDAGLPHVKAAPPLTTTATEPAGPAGPPHAHP